MTFQIVLNIIIAIMWMFLSESYTFSTFAVGYILGITLLFLMNRFTSGRFYFQSIISIIKLVLLFIRELILSNIDIVKLVYKPKIDVKPGIFGLPTELKKEWEITLLANLISLTPGTLSLEVSEDKSTIFIHAMDIQDLESSIREIKETFEKAIMEVSR
ncbi:Na+/H+ antiporter subunit E [Halobacillus massiliensis]|uniref:Na+/H+ antiporter subunit E n=1 Tax=Halobacillus massiliensis TaxID=1926286 RepID=UPI0009E25484|nr:Na+/H+ antiporter subunit E [Halobacillus massiliensis]